jgi:hypothetical protein
MAPPARDSVRMTALESIPLSAACGMTLHRTLRIPDDGREHPLPPSLGAMSAYVAGPDEYVVPMRRAEALWLEFRAPWWKPHAVKVGIGGINAISGTPFADGLTGDPQDYVVVPDQPWLDGINAGDGFIRQFVAVPLGEGLTVEGQLTGDESEGSLTVSLHAPRPGRFPDEEPTDVVRIGGMDVMACAAPMGLGAGGRMRQEIYADEHGVDRWEPEPAARARIELVDALAFEVLTRLPAPPPVVDAATYTRFGLPWFDLVDAASRDIAAAERLRGVRSIADLERRRDEPLPIPDAQVVRLLRLRHAARA